MKNKPYPLNNVPEVFDLKQLVDYCEEKYGSKTSFRYIRKNKEITKTYKEFKEDVEALGTYFLSKGYNHSHIAIIGENSYELVLTYFAVINSGNVIVPLAKESTVDDLKYLYENSDTSLIVHSNDYCEEAQSTGCKALINTKDMSAILEEGKALVSAGDSSYKNLVIDKDGLAVLVYTSGTTGNPKGVMLTHGSITFDIVATLKNITFPDSSFLMLPLHHILAFIACIVAPMFGGASIFINSSMKNLMSDIEFAKPKYIACVPLVLEAFHRKIQESLESSGKDKAINTLIKISNGLLKVGVDVRRRLFKKILDAFGGNLETIVVGGAPVHEKCVTDFYNFGIEVLTGYGTTELASVSTMRNKHFDPKSIGSVHPGIDIRIADGEIQVKGPALFHGYYKNEEATKQAFDGEWFKTGDIGKIENGLLYIDGRIKNLIILPNGENVSPEELELKLMGNIPKITEVIVFEKDGLIFAEIFAKDTNENTKEEIEKMVFEYNKNLPIYKQIGKVVFRSEEFPKTTTKKIKRV